MLFTVQFLNSHDPSSLLAHMQCGLAKMREVPRPTSALGRSVLGPKCLARTRRDGGKARKVLNG